MMAEPQIDWQGASVVANSQLARGTMQVSIEAAELAGYQPGHILGFEFAHPESGEPLKGPYTVSRSNGTRFDIIYRVIPDGRKTPFMEHLEPGAAVRIGGKFGVPVADGIANDVERVVGIATGAGIGPLLGFAEDALAAGSKQQIELFCGFRDLADVCCRAECDALEAQHPNFAYTPVISRPMACTAVAMAGASSGSSLGLADLSAEVAAEVPTEAAAAKGFVQGRLSRVLPGLLGKLRPTTHFHLVGNGALVADMLQGLLAAGVAESRVTTEKYFNGKAEADEDVVAFLASALQVTDV